MRREGYSSERGNRTFVQSLHLYALSNPSISFGARFHFRPRSFTGLTLSHLRELVRYSKSQMAGIEVAGLILGGIPLVISAMEHYADTVSTLGRYRRYKLELETLINILETERVKLMNTFEKLLVGIVPNGKIENIIENPFGKSWKDDEVHAKIRERLWESFTVFEKTVNNVHAAIQEMKSRLGLQPDGKVSAPLYLSLAIMSYQS